MYLKFLVLHFILQIFSVTLTEYLRYGYLPSLTWEGFIFLSVLFTATNMTLLLFMMIVFFFKFSRIINILILSILVSAEIISFLFLCADNSIDLEQYPAVFITKAILLMSLCTVIKFFTLCFDKIKSKNLIELDIKKPKNHSSKSNEVIILLHGACKTSGHMSHIARPVQKLGYRVYNLNYNWRYQEATKIIKDVGVKVRYIEREYNKVHFIGHSLGGLIIRGVLTNYKPANLGRVIQIASPNQGSKLAEKFKDNWIYKKLYKKVSQDLVPKSKFLKSLEPDIKYELGIIAGDSFNFFIHCLLNFKQNDGRVAIEETALEDAKDHTIINVNHNEIVKSPEALHQIQKFLTDGRFECKKGGLYDSKS